MESRQQHGMQINTHILNASVSTATSLLTLPVMGREVSISLNQTGLNAAAKIILEWSNDGISKKLLTDSTGTAIEIDWASASASVGILLQDISFAYLHISLNKLTATAGTITDIITTGLGGVPALNSTGTGLSVKGIGTTTATVYANISPNPSSNVKVEYGLSTAYGSSTTTKRVNKIGNIEFALTGLTTNTTYHYRIVMQNVSGTSYTEDKTFKTL